jgi:hypothetical protein
MLDPEYYVQDIKQTSQIECGHKLVARNFTLSTEIMEMPCQARHYLGDPRIGFGPSCIDDCVGKIWIEAIRDSSNVEFFECTVFLANFDPLLEIIRCNGHFGARNRTFCASCDDWKGSRGLGSKAKEDAK